MRWAFLSDFYLHSLDEHCEMNHLPNVAQSIERIEILRRIDTSGERQSAATSWTDCTLVRTHHVNCIMSEFKMQKKHNLKMGNRSIIISRNYMSHNWKALMHHPLMLLCGLGAMVTFPSRATSTTISWTVCIRVFLSTILSYLVLIVRENRNDCGRSRVKTIKLAESMSNRHLNN